MSCGERRAAQSCFGTTGGNVSSPGGQMAAWRVSFGAAATVARRAHPKRPW